MEQEGSSPKDNSMRSRPKYPHPILLEDGGGSRAIGPTTIEAPLDSPSSPHASKFMSDYDPEAPYPHTERSYGYVPSGPSFTNQSTGMDRMSSNPSSPTGIYHAHHFSPDHAPAVPNAGQASHLHYTSSSSGHSPPRIPEPDYYQGVLPFGPPNPSQVTFHASFALNILIDVSLGHFDHATPQRRLHLQSLFSRLHPRPRRASALFVQALRSQV